MSIVYKLVMIEKNQVEKSVELSVNDMDILYDGLFSLRDNLQYDGLDENVLVNRMNDLTVVYDKLSCLGELV
jgi:hypothetical protein